MQDAVRDARWGAGTQQAADAASATGWRRFSPTFPSKGVHTPVRKAFLVCSGKKKTKPAPGQLEHLGSGLTPRTGPQTCLESPPSTTLRAWMLFLGAKPPSTSGSPTSKPSFSWLAEEGIQQRAARVCSATPARDVTCLFSPRQLPHQTCFSFSVLQKGISIHPSFPPSPWSGARLPAHSPAHPSAPIPASPGPRDAPTSHFPRAELGVDISAP